ncbi:MAG: protein kinase domain-containing protein [Cyclonatronaceae bacterium]
MNPNQWEQYEALYIELQQQPEAQRKHFIDHLKIDDEVRDLLMASLEETDRSEQFFDSLRGVADEILNEKALEFERPPEKIGAYRIAHKIGRGGFSSVYLATRDNDFSHRIAVKILHRGLEGSSALNRFYSERSILASLNHPGIATLYDGGVTEDGRPYLFMEYIDGVHIDRYCADNNLELEKRLRLFLIICETISYAHRNLVIHRDIKPSNILVDSNGRVKLLDFGIAKLLDDNDIEADLHETRLGTRVLTPMYSSPEQIRSEPITTASDVYQLGLLLYRMLTGGYPYNRETTNRYDLEQSILNDDPLLPTSRPFTEGYIEPARLRGDLEHIILMALNKEPSARYDSVSGLADDIQRHLDGHPVKAVKPTLGYRSTRFIKRHKTWAIPSMVIILILVGSLIGLLYQSRIIKQERDLAMILERQSSEEAAKAEKLSEYLIELFRVNDPTQGGSQDLTARELLDRGAETLSERFTDEPEIQALFGETLGRIYMNIGLFDQSRVLLEQANEIRHELNDPVALARSYNYLGSMFNFERSFQLATENYKNGLSLLETEDAVDEELFINLLAGYASSLREAGSPDSAAIFMDRAYTLGSTVYEESDRRMVRLKSEYAFILRGLDRLDEAEAIYREVLSAVTVPEVTDTLTAASTMNNLAYLLRLRERYDEAAEFYRISLALHEGYYGDTHPRTIMINNNMASAYSLAGSHITAESLFLESLERSRLGQPENHWRTGSSHAVLGRFYHSIGRYNEADSMFVKAHAIYVIALGEDHEWTTGILNERARTLAELNRTSEIKPLLTRVIRLTEARYGTGHDNIRNAGEIMAELNIE